MEAFYPMKLYKCRKCNLETYDPDPHFHKNAKNDSNNGYSYGCKKCDNERNRAKHARLYATGMIREKKEKVTQSRLTREELAEKVRTDELFRIEMGAWK